MNVRSDANVWSDQQRTDLSRSGRDLDMQHDVLLQDATRSTATRYNIVVNRLAVGSGDVYYLFRSNSRR